MKKHPFCRLGVHAWRLTSRVWFARHHINKQRCARCNATREVKVDE